MGFSTASVSVLALFVLQTVSGEPARWTAVRNVLLDDMMYTDLLSERVWLNKDRLPPGARDLLNDYDFVDPLIALHKLVRSDTLGEYNSQSAMTLGLTILDVAASCLILKQAAVHIALALRMDALETDKKQLAIRAAMFVYVIPYGANVLSLTDRRAYNELMSVYEAIVAAFDPNDSEKFDSDKFVNGLTASMKTVIACVKESCRATDISDFFYSLQLPTVDEENLNYVFPLDYNVSTKLELPTIVALMRDNEKSMLERGEKLSVLATHDVAVMQSLLKGYPKISLENFKKKQSVDYLKETNYNVLDTWAWKYNKPHARTAPAATTSGHEVPITFLP